MDIVLNDGSVTGQTIAVQIKSGSSFLTNRNSAGYVFTGELKHLNYYLNLGTPVLIILCDLDAKTCFWEVLDPLKTEKSGSNWRITIPFAQPFSSAAKTKLLKLVGEPEDHLDALGKHWALTQALHDADRVLLVVSRRDVQKSDLTHVLSFFSRLSTNTTTALKLQGRIIFSIDGYEKDKRELWEIPEVRKRVVKAEASLDSWFWFLAPDLGIKNSLKLLLTCICNVRRIVVKDGIQKLEIEFTDCLEPFLTKNFNGLNRLTETLGIEEQNERISRAAIAALELPILQGK